MTSDNQMDRYEPWYLDTKYVADLGPGLKVTIRIGEVCPELDAFLLTHNVTYWSFLTASNPRSIALAEAENNASNARLRSDLTSLGLEIFDGKGIARGGGWCEKSFLVLGLGKQEGLNLANEYGQLAFVFGSLGEAAELVPSTQQMSRPYDENR